MICEQCGKEHDGLYGTGRFCSKACRYTFIGKSTKHHVNNLKDCHRRHAEYGRWKCSSCGKIFNTRALLKEHKKNSVCHRQHPWNKGLTKETSEIVKRGVEILKSRYASGELMPSHKGCHHSEATRKKISESCKKFYKEHPNLVPYKLHHSSSESFPEKYFNELLLNEGIAGFSRELRVCGYFLDFGFEDSKIDLEIGGSQHKVDSRIVEHDKKRTEKLELTGWTVIRVDWSEWQRKSLESKKQWISWFKNVLENK